MRLAALCAGLCTLLPFARPIAAEPEPVQDLAYGEGLFLYFKDDYFGAITRLLAAQTREELPHHTEDAELLLGGLHLSYGQQDTATAIFERLLDESVSPEVRDRAWFYLGKMAYQRGRPDEAQRAFARIDGRDLPEELDAERRLIHAQLLMQQERFGEAVAQLDDWEGPRDWLAYARYNLGVALVRYGRTEDGVELLSDIGGGEVVPHARWKDFFVPWRLFGRRHRAGPEYGEQQALSDKANLALGYAWLQSDAPAKAVAPLSRVRADGPWASKARLGQGWAHASLEQYDAALAAWQQLANGDPLDAAVQESHLAIPYAQSRIDATSDASVRSYHDAIAAFQGELVLLGASERAIAGGELLTAVLAEDRLDDMSWFWQLEKLPVNAQTRHLYQVLAAHDFQEGLKTYRDLRFLQRNLDAWRTGVDAFSAMLESREQRYEARLGRLEQTLGEDRLERLDARTRELAARIDAIEASEDAIALANEAELASWRRLDRVAERLARLPDDATTSDARTRYRIMRGLLRWQIEAQYSERMWSQRKALRELEQLVADTHARRERLAALRTEVPASFSGYAERIAALTPRIEALRARVDAALGMQGGALQQVALAEVEGQKARLQAYLTEAQFALAAVHDRAAHAAEQP